MSELLPPVVGRLMGDTRDFSEKWRAARTQAGQDTEGVSSSAERMRGRVGGAFTAMGGLATGAGVALEHMGHQGEVAEAQLKTAIDNSGHSFEEYKGRIGSTTDKMMGFGFSHSETEKALAQLATATQDPNKALTEMGLVADIARAKHMSLESAANKVGLMHAGNTRIFKQFGIQLSANASAADKNAAMAELMRRVHGQAAAQADNFGGKVASAKEHLEAMGESIGRRVGPAMTLAGPMMMGLGQVISSGLVPKLIMGVGGMFQFAASAIGTGISAAAAAIPIIIAWAPVILAIMAVVAVGYLLYKEWDNIMAGLKIIVNSVVGFVSDHWRLLVDIILGPLGLIITNWSTIWNTFTSVVSAVWNGVTSVVKGGINDVLSVINGFIGAIDSIEIHIPSVGIGPIHTPGFDWGGLGIPTIPYLALGGTAVNAGWAVVGDKGPELMHMPVGASVAPMPRGGAIAAPIVHLHLEGNTIIGGDMRRLAQDLVGHIRTELIRTGDRQALGLPA